MYSVNLTILNPTGLHARPASRLTQVCKEFPENDILIRFGSKEINPKSIISVLSAGIVQNTDITLEVSGKDEEQVGLEIAELIAGFSE